MTFRRRSPGCRLTPPRAYAPRSMPSSPRYCHTWWRRCAGTTPSTRSANGYGQPNAASSPGRSVRSSSVCTAYSTGSGIWTSTRRSSRPSTRIWGACSPKPATRKPGRLAKTTTPPGTKLSRVARRTERHWSAKYTATAWFRSATWSSEPRSRSRPSWLPQAWLKELLKQMERIFGIDLGTTNSVIAYTDPTGTTEVIAGKDGNRILPSVVYFGNDGTQLVGTSARQRAIIEPERVAMLFKRGMGEKTFLDDGQPFVVDGTTYSPEQLSASVLKKLALMAGEQFGEPARKGVITVPAYFGDDER